MNIVSNIDEWRLLRPQLTGSIGFIPTMGHLHAGHMSLCKRSALENDITVVSIFVNPTQFDQASDFNHYPRSIEQDKSLLAEQHVNYLFLPNADAMYADQYAIQLTENNIATHLEGHFRPGHFSGMLTIVLKLLNLIAPKRTYFGEKDYQQLLLVKKMVAALFLTVDVIGCETIRAEDGLALSSRNSRLNSVQRQLAAHFPRLLQSTVSNEEISEELLKLGFRVDYIINKWERRLGAVWIDDIRLIDNFPIKREKEKCYYA